MQAGDYCDSCRIAIGKKAAFLQEALRVLRVKARVHAGRAEELGGTFDCVVLRAVDKMSRAVAVAPQLVAPESWLALMTTTADLPGLQIAAGTEFVWRDLIRLPRSNDRFLALGKRKHEKFPETQVVA